MQAQVGRTYAHIQNGRVQWVFTSTDLPAWNENDLLVVEVPQGQAAPAVGDLWNGTTFSTPVKPALTRAQRRSVVDGSLPTQLSADITYNGHVFQADERSRNALTSAAVFIASGQSVPKDYFWRDKNNENVPFTNEDVLALHAAVVARNWGAYLAAFNAKDAIG